MPLFHQHLTLIKLTPFSRDTIVIAATAMWRLLALISCRRQRITLTGLDH